MKSQVRAPLQPAFVLHQRPYRDTSRLIELYTASAGRIGLVARGSRFRSLLQPFQPLLAAWILRGELGTLTAAEPDGYRPPLRGDALLAAFYLNELLLKLTTRHDAAPSVFSCYATTLHDLHTGSAVAGTLRLFEKRLLELLGYGLLLDHDINGMPIAADAWYRYAVERGPEQLTGFESGSLVLRGGTLLALARESLDDPEHLVGARRLLRAALDSQLAGRVLKTRELLRALRQSPAKPE